MSRKSPMMQKSSIFRKEMWKGIYKNKRHLGGLFTISVHTMFEDRAIHGMVKFQPFQDIVILEDLKPTDLKSKNTMRNSQQRPHLVESTKKCMIRYRCH